jgi:hypothetical protein
MNKNSERWQDYPYLVEWVAQMNEWAAKYQIYECLEADDSGEDPSGRQTKTLCWLFSCLVKWCRRQLASRWPERYHQFHSLVTVSTPSGFQESPSSTS